MDKIWYLYLSNRHLGPFSIEEVLLKLDQKHVDFNTLIWREGQKNWEPLANLSDFEKIISLSKVELQKIDKKDNLPPLPEDDEVYATDSEYETIDVDEKKAPRVDREDFQDTFSFAPIETNDQVSEEVKTERREVERANVIAGPMQDQEPIYTETISLGEDNRGSDEIKRNSFKFPIAISLAVFLIGITYSLTLFQKKDSGYLDNKDIFNYHRNLFSSISTKDGRKVISDIAFTKDAKEIVGVVNQPGLGEVNLKLRSVENKIISDDSVLIFSTGSYKDHYFSFNKFDIEKGKAFHQGYYQYDLQFIDKSSLGRLKFFLSKTPLKNWFDSLRNYQKNYTFKGESLLSADPKKTFNSKLMAFKAKANEGQVEKLSTLLEMFRTTKGRLTQLNKLFNTTLVVESYKHAQTVFEEGYAKDIAPFVNQFAITSDANKEDELGEFYIKLLEGQKGLGGVSVEISKEIAKISKDKSSYEKNKSNLIKTYREKISTLGKGLDFQINAIKAELERILR